MDPTYGCVYFLALPGGPIKISRAAFEILHRKEGDNPHLIGVIKTNLHSEMEKGLHALFEDMRRGSSEWFNIDLGQARKVIQIWEDLMDIDGEQEIEKCRRFVNILRRNF
jgi:hypothetical protein